ncbi:hypothetical protein TNCT_542721 [Trichonephila clavata]|uniref:Uncharacterized protein n=1 Tax=Trichonephila clavata TaxID=2740835 RepID=A0A8X6GZ64_TRICU|nr:hypothetical protein TNCT_542721 [Trichonephila clavata]
MKCRSAIRQIQDLIFKGTPKFKNDIQSKRHKLFPNMKRNSQNLDPFVIRVEELGIPRGVENHKKTSRNHQIDATKNNEHLQEPSSTILMAKVAIPGCSPAKEEKKNRRFNSHHVSARNSELID